MSVVEAQEYFEQIKTGHKHAMRRPGIASVDRKLRELIENANASGDCIINVGNGYFRPDPEDIVDCAQFSEYTAKDLARARAILYKRKMMIAAFERIGMQRFLNWAKKEDTGCAEQNIKGEYMQE